MQSRLVRTSHLFDHSWSLLQVSFLIILNTFSSYKGMYVYVGEYGIGMAELEEMEGNNHSLAGSASISTREAKLPNTWLVVFLWL